MWPLYPLSNLCELRLLLEAVEIMFLSYQPEMPLRHSVLEMNGNNTERELKTGSRFWTEGVSKARGFTGLILGKYKVLS